jgi:hypothetical protein
MILIPNNGMDKRRGLCRSHIVAAGFPNRGQIILRREEYLYPQAVGNLMGLGKGGYEDISESLTFEILEEAFTDRDALILPEAAFLAGRCQLDDEELQKRLNELLRELIESLPVDNLDIMDEAYIEAAMSLALRGDPGTARKALVPLVTDYAASTMRSYLAAFYLAQLGDPSGYPSMLTALRSTNEHTRLMAVRHLIAFKPYDGQTIRGKLVDIKAEFIERLRDSHSYVRVEVPYLLAEADIEGLEELLLPVAEADADMNVRQAARNVLESFNAE